MHRNKLTLQLSHTVLCVAALLQAILTFPLVIDDVFAQKIVVAQNYGGVQQGQALLEPHQLSFEGLEAWDLQTQPGGSRGVKNI